MLNLTNNAIKFTQKGEVLISVTTENESDIETVIKFMVKDTGMGIAKGKQKGLFEAFTQADASTTRKFGGTGLGLAISSQLVKQMNGQLKLTSEIGEGSEFYFTIPLKKLPDSLSKDNIKKLDLSGTSTVIIDDNDTNLYVFESYLSYWNTSVTKFCDPIKAIEKIVEAEQNGNSFDLILVDYQMPSMNGMDFMKLLKSKLKKPVKSILISSVVTLINKDDILKAGFDAGLSKPVKHHDLFVTVSKVLLGKNEDLHLKSDSKKASVNTKVKLNILLAEDNIINQKVAKVNIEKLGHTVDIADNGKIAVDLYKKNQYDMILMDIQMPEKSGYEATTEIREIEKQNKITEPIYIVAMTAGAMKKDKEAAFAHDMDDYLSKPFKPNELFEIISKRIIINT